MSSLSLCMLAMSFSCSKECEQKVVATGGSVKYVSVHIAVLAIAESINTTVFPVLFKYLIVFGYSGLFVCLFSSLLAFVGDEY